MKNTAVAVLLSVLLSACVSQPQPPLLVGMTHQSDPNSQMYQMQVAAMQKQRQEAQEEEKRRAQQAWEQSPEGKAAVAGKERAAQADAAAKEADRESKEKADEAARAARAARDAQMNDPHYRAKYVADMDRQYGHIIHFDSQRSMSAITSFKLDCPGTNHRMLPLYNVLLATAASDEKMAISAGQHMQYEVQGAEGETRVVRGISGQDRGEVFLTINKWGELHSTHIEAMESACALGTYGPIWN